MNPTGRSQLRRLPVRGSHEAEAIYQILDAGMLAHVGFSVDGQPFVIPTLYARSENHLYLHGSAASRLLRQLEHGIPACVTVALIDGLVLARSAFHHSMNYRSVVAFGAARKLDDPQQKMEALRAISEHLIPGRWDNVRPPDESELRATSVVDFCMEEASAKIRTGKPIDDEADYTLPVWAGVLPLTLTPGEPIPDSLPDCGGVPDYIRMYRRT